MKFIEWKIICFFLSQCQSFSGARIEDLGGVGGVNCDRKIPHHRFDVNFRWSLPCFTDRSISWHEIRAGCRHELKMQSPPDIDFLGSEWWCHMKWNGQNHLSLEEPDADLVVFRKVGDLSRRILRRVFVFGWRFAGNFPREDFFALQCNRQLHAANSSTWKVQGSDDVFAELVARFEETKPTDFAASVGNDVEVGSTACCDVLQIFQRDFHFRDDFSVVFQKGICRCQFVVGNITRRWLLFRFVFDQQRQNANRNLKQLNSRPNALGGYADFVIILDVDTAVSGWTRWNLLTVVI